MTGISAIFIYLQAAQKLMESVQIKWNLVCMEYQVILKSKYIFINQYQLILILSTKINIKQKVSIDKMLLNSGNFVLNFST